MTFCSLYCSPKSFSSCLTSSSWIYLKILLETPECICCEFWAGSSDPWTGLWPSSRREARRASSRILKFFIKQLLLNLILASLVFLWIEYKKKGIVNENFVNFTLVHCSLNDSFQTRPRLGTLTGTFPFSLLQDKTPKLIFYKSNP